MSKLTTKNDAGDLDFIGRGFEYKFATPEADDGVFEGYASVFNVMDDGGDNVQPGAFKKSLRQRPAAKVKMLFQHHADSIIGIWDEITEDEKGLKVKGHLLLDLPLAQQVRVLMKAKALDGMSIGFRTIKADIDRATGMRLLQEAQLWEISIVTFPMLPAATVTAVKGESVLGDARAMEQAYRDGGLSAGDAKIAVSITKKMVQRDAGRTEHPTCDGLGDALLSIRKAAEAMRQ
jgi:uncharacterized protein